MHSEETSRAADRSPGPLASTLAVGMATALAVALGDATLSLDRLTGWAPRVLVVPAAALAGATLAGFLGAALILGTLLLRLARLPAPAVLGGIGVGLAAPPLLRAWGWERAFSVDEPAFGAVLAVVCATVAILVQLGLDAVRRRPHLGLALGLATPAALAGVLAARRWGAPAWLEVAVFVVLTPLVVRLLGRPLRIARAIGILGLLTAALLAAGLALSDARRPTSLPPQDGAQPPGPKHVLLITADTLRADALSCYGGPARTPSIDALALDGVLFRRSYSTSPWTLPSFTSLMTGLSPAVHFVRHVADRPARGLPTLPVLLSRAGYGTAAIGDNWFLTPHGSRRTLDQGFDLYDFYPHERPDTVALALLGGVLDDPLELDATTDELTDRAVAFIDAHHERPFFLWLHYYDPHGPYKPPPRFRPAGEPHPAVGMDFGDEVLDVRNGDIRISTKLREWVQGLYHGEVRLVDEGIGRVLAALRETGIYDDALVVFTSDHGDEHFEHGGVEHGHSLYDEVIRVPLVVKLPGSVGRPAVETPVSGVSIAPTILDLCDVRHDESRFEGRSLRTTWEGPSDGPASDDEPVPTYAGGLVRFSDRDAIIFGDHKYIRYLHWPREELYDLRADPGEQEDLASTEPDLLREGRRLLNAHHRNASDVRARLRLVGAGRAGTIMGEDERRMLRQMGYLK